MEASRLQLEKEIGLTFRNFFKLCYCVLEKSVKTTYGLLSLREIT